MPSANLDSHEVTLRDGTRVWLLFAQIVKGCRDSLSDVRSYEGYVIRNAISGSEYAQKWIDMHNAVKNPVET